MELCHFFCSSTPSGTFRILIKSMMELFVLIANGFKPLTNFANAPS